MFVFYAWTMGLYRCLCHSCKVLCFKYVSSIYVLFYCLHLWMEVHRSATALTHATCFAAEYAPNQEKHCQFCRTDNKTSQKTSVTEVVEAFKWPNAMIRVREELAPNTRITTRLAKNNAILFQMAAPSGHRNHFNQWTSKELTTPQQIKPGKVGPVKNRQRKGSWIFCGREKVRAGKGPACRQGLALETKHTQSNVQQTSSTCRDHHVLASKQPWLIPQMTLD